MKNPAPMFAANFCNDLRFQKIPSMRKMWNYQGGHCESPRALRF